HENLDTQKPKRAILTLRKNHLSPLTITRRTHLAMILTSHRPHEPGDIMISFPRRECCNNTTNMATVVAEVDKKRVLCRISLQSLKDKFGSIDADDELMRSVAQHRTAIQEAARRLIENGHFEVDGSVLIHASFWSDRMACPLTSINHLLG
ncbi:MAG: DUF1488 family protein, partial [Methylicorpusculum sp.]|nr:DUF1488 family protein [Methylicorpusculum sp.]